MKKYITIIVSSFLFSSITYANNPNIAIQKITKQRDIADYNCRNQQPNPKASIGFCKKRDGLDRKLQNMKAKPSYQHKYNPYPNNHNH